MIHFAGESGISICGFCGFEADRSAKLASDLEIGFLRSSNPFFGRIWPSDRKKNLGLRLERGRILVLNTSENMLIWHDMATSMRLSCQPMWPYQLPGALKGAPKRGKAQSMPCHDLPNAKSLGGLSNSLRGNSDGGFQGSISSWGQPISSSILSGFPL